ncbi:MAG: ribosomal-processing cysteine protease Prp [Bacillota bacterium]
MVKIDFIENSVGEIISFTITGHAGMASSGRDILCAAVSVLAQTSVLGLLDYLSIKLRLKMRPGNMLCELPEDMQPFERQQANAILETAYLGLSSLKKGYPRRIEIKRRRCE